MSIDPIKFEHSNNKKVMVKFNDIEADGMYSCEVSTETPIYTKESIGEHLYVLGEYNKNKNKIPRQKMSSQKHTHRASKLRSIFRYTYKYSLLI